MWQNTWICLRWFCIFPPLINHYFWIVYLILRTRIASKTSNLAKSLSFWLCAIHTLVSDPCWSCGTPERDDLKTKTEVRGGWVCWKGPNIVGPPIVIWGFKPQIVTDGRYIMVYRVYSIHSWTTIDLYLGFWKRLPQVVASPRHCLLNPRWWLACAGFTLHSSGIYQCGYSQSTNHDAFALKLFCPTEKWLTFGRKQLTHRNHRCDELLAKEKELLV